MQQKWCQKCGEPVFIVQTARGTAEVDTTPVERGAYVIAVKPVGGFGQAGTYRLHQCTTVKHRKRSKEQAVNRARAVLGLEPLYPEDE